MVFDDDTGNAAIDDDLHGIVQSVNGQARRHARRCARARRNSGASAIRAPTCISTSRCTGHRFRIVADDGEATVDARSE